MSCKFGVICPYQANKHPLIVISIIIIIVIILVIIIIIPQIGMLQSDWLRDHAIIVNSQWHYSTLG